MAKEHTHFKFFIGGLAVTVEGGHGYAAPKMYDGVTISVRTKTEKGVGGRVSQGVGYVRREEMAAIGLSFLDVASKMAASTMWARSETVFSSSQQAGAIPLTAKTRAELAALSVDGNFVRDSAATFERLKGRAHILQRAQHLLERCDDASAKQIELILLAMESGGLPFQMGFGFAVAAPEDGGVPSGTVPH